jgi:hypothetical protein
LSSRASSRRNEEITDERSLGGRGVRRREQLGKESVEADLEEEPLLDPIELDDPEFVEDETEDDF